MATTNTAAAPADDFIPAPADSGVSTAVAAVANATTEALTTPEPPRIGQTELILGIVAVLALAGLLLLVRNAVRKSLIAARATIDSANAAAWSWYLVLLLAGALIIAGIVGRLFASGLFMAVTAATLIVGVLLAFTMTARARRSA